jgi:hypothetical protein
VRSHHCLRSKAKRKFATKHPLIHSKDKLAQLVHEQRRAASKQVRHNPDNVVLLP